MHVAAALVVGLAVPLPALASIPEPAPAVLRWSEPALGRGSAPLAVATDPTTRRIAVGDERGFEIGSDERTLVSVSTRAPVRALAFATSGELLVGTDDGLFVFGADGTLVDRSPGAGEEARAIERLAVEGVLVAAATPSGLHVSEDLVRWRRLPGARRARAMALRSDRARAFIVCVDDADVLETALDLPAGASGAPSLASLAGIPASVRASALDVRFSAEGDLAIVTPDRVVERPRDGGELRVVRPGLAPGASLKRIAAAAGRLWLATDRGLLEAESLAGPWTRPGPGSPAASVVDLAGDPTRLLAATEQGLVVAVAGREEPLGEGLRAARVALEFPAHDEPAIGEIFEAALDRLDLRPEAMRDLRRGLSLRGLLPELSLRVDRAHLVEAEHGLDESFVSGGLRSLADANRAVARESAAVLSLTWELGSLAYDDSAIDLSREARSVIQLRDDVLDEITQLYFERRRVLAKLARLGPAAHGDEADGLRLRADELAAGLDAWTGGWFGRRSRAQAP